MLPRRPIPKCCTNEEIFFDPSSQVGKAMGGREFFFNVDARRLHRVGLMRGLAWLLPFGEARDGIDYIRITIREGGCGTYDVSFGRMRDRREGIDVYASLENPFSIEQIRMVEGVHPSKLREVYDRETINA